LKTLTPETAARVQAVLSALCDSPPEEPLTVAMVLGCYTYEGDDGRLVAHLNVHKRFDWVSAETLIGATAMIVLQHDITEAN